MYLSRPKHPERCQVLDRLHTNSHPLPSQVAVAVESLQIQTSLFIKKSRLTVGMHVLPNLNFYSCFFSMIRLINEPISNIFIRFLYVCVMLCAMRKHSCVRRNTTTIPTITLKSMSDAIRHLQSLFHSWIVGNVISFCHTPGPHRTYTYHILPTTWMPSLDVGSFPTWILSNHLPCSTPSCAPPARRYKHIISTPSYHGESKSEMLLLVIAVCVTSGGKCNIHVSFDIHLSCRLNGADVDLLTLTRVYTEMMTSATVVPRYKEVSQSTLNVAK